MMKKKTFDKHNFTSTFNSTIMRVKHLLIAALLVVPSLSFAQQENPAEAQQMPLIPEDTAVIVGHLDNGLTYYIRHNNYPKGKVNFYIAQRVGAIQEEDDQDGLAHFLEHMAFNGSKHFPGDTVTKFMDDLGAQWNAYTTSDHTVYHVNGVSNERESALDSCLLLLSDWSEGLTLDESQLNDQRDVVHNEYRSHNAIQRLAEQSLPALFPNSRYGTRTVIGNMDVVDHCNSNRLRDYYHKWYYPANQAIIVVGDIDPHKFEAKIKKLFAPLPVPPTAHKAEDLQVDDNDTTLYYAGSDKEMAQTYFVIFRKDEVIPAEMKQTIPYMLMQDLKELGTSMFNNRMRTLAQQPNADFVLASSTDTDYGMTSRTRKALTLQVVPKPGKETAALKQALTEMKRVQKYGFTNSEFKQAMDAFKAELEKNYNNRATIKNDDYAQTLIENFLDKEPYPSIDQEYPIQQQVLPMLNAGMVNQAIEPMFDISEKNFAVAAYAMQKDGKPVVTLADLKKAVADARNTEVSAPVDTMKEVALMPVLPKAGKIVKETTNNKLGYKELTLSNGAKVILKKTDYKANEILVNASAPGGKAVAKDEDLSTRRLFETAFQIHGLGTKSYNDLQNLAQTKQTNVSDGISNDLHYVTGSTTNENIETLMQELNLSFTGVKKDDAFYQQILSILNSYASSKQDNPESIINDSTEYYTHSKRADVLSPDPADLTKASYDKILNLRRQLFSNAADFTFVFVGSFDEAKIRPLIERYIASLPSTKKKTVVVDDRSYTKGKVDREFTTKMGNPQSVTMDTYRSEKVPYTLKNLVNAQVLGQVLWNKEFDIIRERESAAYTPQPSATLENDLTGSYLIISSQLQTNPAKTARATELADSIVTTIAKGVTPDDIQKGREALQKSHDDAVKTNSYWMDVLSDYAIYAVDKHTDYNKELRAVNPASIGEIANTILKAGNHVRVEMNAVPNK
jgi:zinc protease